MILLQCSCKDHALKKIERKPRVSCFETQSKSKQVYGMTHALIKRKQLNYTYVKPKSRAY